jgi:hypothetical protein
MRNRYSVAYLALDELTYVLKAADAIIAVRQPVRLHLNCGILSIDEIRSR